MKIKLTPDYSKITVKVGDKIDISGDGDKFETMKR